LAVLIQLQEQVPAGVAQFFGTLGAGGGGQRRFGVIAGGVGDVAG
jgi:hypothetical protein